MIGIGAGPGTDGQVLVFHDLLGIREGLGARFVKRYADAQERDGRRRRARTPTTCATRRFPAPEHSYSIDAGASSPRFRAELRPQRRRRLRRV